MVYVDDMNASYGRMVMCHMMADTIEELHEMAAALGLERAWFQPLSRPHYDVSKTRKAEAVRLGAVEVTQKELVRINRAREGRQ